MLKRLRSVVTDEPGRVDPKHRPTMANRDVLPDPIANLDPYGQFLSAFAGQRDDLGLTGFHLPARKLPPAGHLGWA